VCGKDGLKGVIQIGFCIDWGRTEGGGPRSGKAAPTTSKVSPIGDVPLVLKLAIARGVRLFVFHRASPAWTALEKDVLGVVDVEEEGGKSQVAAFVVGEETASSASTAMSANIEERAIKARDMKHPSEQHFMSAEVEAHRSDPNNGDLSVISHYYIFTAILDVFIFDKPFTLDKEIAASAGVGTDIG
jgi:hypothetical protein